MSPHRRGARPSNFMQNDSLPRKRLSRHATRRRQASSKAAIREWRGSKKVNTYRSDVLSKRLPRESKTTAHPYGGHNGQSRWPWSRYALPPDPAWPKNGPHRHGGCRPTRVVDGRREPEPDEAVDTLRAAEMARLRAGFADKQAARKDPPPFPQPQPQLQPQPHPPPAARPTMLPTWPSEAELAELAAYDHDSEDGDMW